ncbi:BTB-POZ domain and tricorn protease domain 2 containing protein [Megavirus chiliensis]|uniref:High-affnity carbon uptake protein Hat n=3 Tax=Megamimivirinae TaxID=3044648 RepID=A0A2L2DL24_MIMIV|nr:putative BTB/POZ domain-containing protein [Megavirus chiliensis]AEQ32964.1 BTB-POZ domain and tricorn protease domain 2 containing protein [Megavirus chiliensis]AGD93080.1 putative BTB/POZ domain-containing protein [Megavirus lba]AVG46868.1 High-affnity carbon uptake protein Hat [Acanthamoeba polyphaga mimivirus]
MDFSKIFNSEKLSDIKLILIDKNNGKKCLNLHKVILYTASSFFEKMFDNFKEKNQSKIVLEVFDVEVFSDILKSFYGIKVDIPENWKYQLANYICRQYLLLEPKLPETLKIPENEFEEFLNITQSLEYTDQVINLVAENLPIDFDLDKLSIELIKEIEKKYLDHKILALGNKSINIIDINNNNNKINTIIKGDLYYLDYIKDLDIIVTRSRKNSKYIFYDLDGNLLDLSNIDENNKKYEYLSENLNDKHFKHVNKLLDGIGQNYEYYNYSSDYKNIIFTTYLIIDFDSDSEDDTTNKSKNLFIYNIHNKKLEIIYETPYHFSSKYIQDRPLFINNSIIFIEGNYRSSEVKIFSINDKIIKTICEIDNDTEIIKYNGDDLILISTGKKNKVFSLGKNTIINEFNFKHELDIIDFISEEIIIALKSKEKHTNIFLYNIITGSLIKKLTIELKIEHIKCISVDSPIKNKLKKYLDNY